MRNRRPLVRALLATVLALLSLPAIAHAAPARPNVVVIETDDQTMADMASMPNTRQLIGDAGVTFDNSFVSLSQCCPSRATFLTGRYAHNHGVLTTQPPFGGFPAFHDSQSLAVWLQERGYATSLVGKYLNQYGKGDQTYIPPGWSDWHVLEGPSTYRFTGFTINDNGHVDAYPGWYQSDVLAALSERFVRRTAPTGQPFFLWTTYVAPHIGVPRDPLLPPKVQTTVPSVLFENAFMGVPMPRSPAYDLVDPARQAIAQTIWRRRQESLMAVDHDVVRMVRTLKETGVLGRTLLIFTSDNGFLIGEHDVTESKVLPYEGSIRVPLMMRGPGIPRGVHRRQLVFNGDLAPTILAATGARAPWEPDGISLLPFARSATADSGRAILLEGPPKGRVSSAPRFTGLRTKDALYVENLDGPVELYDLRTDPFELHDLAGQPEVAAQQAALAARLERLRHCAGADCRA
jgi:arylsulfatase A-like enzyme